MPPAPDAEGVVPEIDALLLAPVHDLQTTSEDLMCNCTETTLKVPMWESADSYIGAKTDRESQQLLPYGSNDNNSASTWTLGAFLFGRKTIIATQSNHFLPKCQQSMTGEGV